MISPHRLFLPLVIVAAVTPASVPPASAQDRGSEADQDACTPDVFRLCEAYIPDEGPIVACLKSKRLQLSPACYKVFYSVPAASRETTAATPHRHRHHRRHPSAQ